METIDRLSYGEPIGYTASGEAIYLNDPTNQFLDDLRARAKAANSVIYGGERRIAVNGSHATYGSLSGSGTTWSVPEGVFIAGSAMVMYRGAIQTDFTETPATGTINLGFTPSLTGTNQLMVTYFNSGTRNIDSSDGSSPYGTLTGTINGSNTQFTVSNGSYTAGSLLVWYRGMLQTAVTETTPASGIFDLGFAPPTGSILVVEYEA
jgi:hypothetical protein